MADLNVFAPQNKDLFQDNSGELPGHDMKKNKSVIDEKIIQDIAYMCNLK